jgi:hypothetical protein
VQDVGIARHTFSKTLNNKYHWKKYILALNCFNSEEGSQILHGVPVQPMSSLMTSSFWHKTKCHICHIAARVMIDFGKVWQQTKGNGHCQGSML